MHQLARRMAGSRDLRKVENERTRLSKIVRENPDVYDRTAAVRPHRECRPEASVRTFEFVGSHRAVAEGPLAPRNLVSQFRH